MFSMFSEMSVFEYKVIAVMAISLVAGVTFITRYVRTYLP